MRSLFYIYFTLLIFGLLTNSIGQNNQPKSVDLSNVHTQVPRTLNPITLLIPYTLDEPADLLVDIKDPNGVYLGGSRRTLGAGQGTASITIVFNQLPSIGPDHRWDVLFVPVGGTFVNASLVDGLDFEVIQAEPNFEAWYQAEVPQDTSAFPIVEDFDNDGIDNFYEFAFGGDPQLDDFATIVPRIVRQPNGNILFRFQRGRYLLNYQIQTSANPSDTNSWVTRAINPGSVGTTVSILVNPNWENGGNKVFARVIATQ